MTQATKTEDEQARDRGEDPFKPFPYRRYFLPIMEVLDNEPETFIWKSRTMMMTWFVCAWAAHRAFTRGLTKVIFESEDEDKSIHCIDCCKALWRNSLPGLRREWALARELDKQPATKLNLANGSKLLGIPQRPDKIRSEHPSIVVMDEAAHIDCGEASYNIAKATKVPKMVILSSAELGWFNELKTASVPAPWPEYKKKVA